MNITFVGTGTMGSISRGNTSILVDDVLFDIGMGTVKQIERLKVYTKNIKYVVISHFHADHFLDIPNLLIGKRIRKEEHKITFIGPEGLRKKVIDLMNFIHGDGNQHKYDEIESKYNIEFVELKNDQSYSGENFNITAFSLNHGNCTPINGYILQKEGKCISYACDTTFCANYYKMCERSDYFFSDVTSINTTQMHMGFNDYIVISKKYPNCKFYAVHRGDYEIDNATQIEIPNDGDRIKI